MRVTTEILPLFGVYEIDNLQRHLQIKQKFQDICNFFYYVLLRRRKNAVKTLKVVFYIVSSQDNLYLINNISKSSWGISKYLFLGRRGRGRTMCPNLLFSDFLYFTQTLVVCLKTCLFESCYSLFPAQCVLQYTLLLRTAAFLLNPSQFCNTESRCCIQ